MFIEYIQIVIVLLIFIENDDPDESPQSENSINSSSTPKPLKRKTVEKPSASWSKAAKPKSIEFEKELLKSLHKKEDVDEATHFGNTVAARLRRMTPYQQAIAQPRILSLLAEFEFSQNSYPTQPVPTTPASSQFSQYPPAPPQSQMSVMNTQYQYPQYETLR